MIYDGFDFQRPLSRALLFDGVVVRFIKNARYVDVLILGDAAVGPPQLALCLCVGAARICLVIWIDANLRVLESLGDSFGRVKGVKDFFAACPVPRVYDGCVTMGFSEKRGKDRDTSRAKYEVTSEKKNRLDAQQGNINSRHQSGILF